MTRPVDGPSLPPPPVVAARRGGVLPCAAAPGCGALLGGRRDLNLRRRLIAVRGADPAHDLAAGVGLQRFERQGLVRRLGDSHGQAEVAELAGIDLGALLGGEGDLGDLLGHLLAELLRLARPGRAS
jgi:hypothetical protein